MNESASVMASQLSSVSTEASAADQIDISSPLNSILKLADYMQQNCTMPSYLTFLFFIWLMYQILMTAFWHAFTSKEIHPKIYYSTLLSSKNMYFIENNSNYNPITFSQRNPFYQNIITKMRQWIQKIPIIGKFSVMHNYTSNSNKLNHVNANPNNQLNFSQKSIKILDDDDHGHDHEGGEVIDGGYCNMLFYTLYKIAFFSETFDKIDDFPIIFIIFSIIFAVSIISLFFAFIRFRMTRQMDKYSVYIVRFLHEFVGLILVHPIASIIGQMCAMLLNDDFFLYFNSHSVIIDADSEDTPVEFFGSGLSSMSYITLTLLFVYLIYFMVWSSFGIGITSASGYIEDSFLMCFDQFPLRAFIIFNALVLLFQPIFIFIGQWAVLSLLIFHCLISIVIFTRFLYIPFYSMFSNIVCNSVIIASFLLDTLVALIYFHAIPKDKGSQYIFLTVFLLALLTSIGLFIYFKRVKIRELFFNRKKNTANGRKHLIDDLNKPSNEELFERFNRMKFSYNYITNFYLHYGIHEMADLFLDMSLIKYIIQNEYSTKNLISCLKFAVVFPCENRLCNQIMILLRGKRDTTIFDKFLIFQVKKIRLLRQSTSSIQSSEQLQEISRLSSTTEMKVSNFFKRRTANCGVLFDIHKYVSKTHSLFMESLISYANSTVFRDAYVNFLIESEADFTGAILETRRRDLIESGMTYAKDLCFKAFVVAYPEYLKEQILTIKRQFIINMKNDGSNSNNENKRSQSTSDELELKVEEEIGKNIIKQARIRIAMQNAIRGKKANNSKILLIFLIVTLIASIALYSAIFGIMYGYFDNRYDATKRSMKCANVLMYFATTNLANLLQWGNITTHFVAGVNREKQWYTHESPYIGFLDYDLTYDKNALAFKDKAQYTYVDLTSDFSDFALNSADRASVQEMSAPLVDPKVEITLCKNGSPEKTIHTGLGMAMTFLYTAQTILSNNRDYFSWFNSSDEFCHVTSVGSSISDSLIEFRMGIVNDEIKTAQKVKLFINEFMIIVSVVFGLYSIGVFLVISFMFLKEINLFVERILGFEKSVLEAASCTLHKNEKDDQMRTDINQNQDKYSNFNIYMYNSIVIILVFGVIALYIVDMLQAETLNKRLEYTTQWSLKSSVRMPYALISLHSLLMALFTSGKQKMEINITTAAKQIKIWSTNIETIIENSDFLIQGDSNIEGIIGFDPVIDDITTKSQCDPDPGNVSMHETYRCNSLNQLYYYYYSLSNDIIEEIDKYDGRIFGKMPGEIPHLVLNHCIPDSVKLNERFDQLVLSFLNDFKTLHTLFFILEIIMIILIFLFGFLLWQHLNNAFSTALLLLRRISPVAVVNNPKILRYILDISMKDHLTEMTTSESIVKNSLSGIICTAQNGSIEIINKSITTILGFSPDQVLGQSIGALFDEESSNIVRQKLELMILKQSALYYEDHVICLDDSNVSVPCQMIIIGVENDEKKLSFVIVLNEESALIEQQETAEKAKARSEKLLYNILPREIVIRINSGEKDISFSVPMATISFIDFVKFSEYSSSLTPKEIMGNLSTFFGAFDEILSKYPMLMKIKLIGDVYMCAGGLFNPDAPPNAHAEQMVNFDIEVLQAIDDLNMKLSTLLSVRIGINTGGPLIAGVLGTDKPVFDIIGDPINIASRLQSTDIPGQIQISQAVHDLICQGDFNIEPRGEVFLKGKGKAQVYLVKPQTVLAFQLSAEMHNSTSSFVNNSAPNIQ